MDTEFRTFLRAMAQGDEPAPLSRDPLWTEAEALARKLIAHSEVEPALKALELEPAARKRWPLLLLTGLLRQGLGERAGALEAFEVVADKLVAATEREGVLLLLPRFLEPEPTGAAVRLLHFLARTAGSDAERIDRLRRAAEIRPGDPALHEELALALERTGDRRAADEHRLRSIDLRLRSGHADGMGEALLRAVEDDLEREPPRIGALLLRFAALAPWEDSEPLLELALPTLEARAGGRLSWDDLEAAGARAPATAAARTLLGRYLRIALANEPEPDAMISGCGILNLAEPIASVGSRLKRIRTFPPGAYASHATWGFGRVIASDGDTLSLEFPGREAHRMSLAMAERSLLRLPSDGLRVLRETQGERLAELVRGRDPEVVRAALRDVGGTATGAQLKAVIEPALKGEEWSPWWKEARERVKGDSGIDTTEAYRQVYRLGESGGPGAEAALPSLQPRAAREGVALLRRFLREHASDEGRLAAHARDLAARWARDAEAELAVRAQALGYAAAWGSLPAEATREVLCELIRAGLRPDDLPLAQSQEQLLDLAVGAAAEAEFLWRAIESRLPRLRERGLSRLRELHGAGFPAVVSQRLARPGESPGAAIRLIEHYASRSDDPESPGVYRLVACALRLLEGDLPESLTEILLGLLGETGALRAAALTRPPAGEEAETLEGIVMHWRGSERRLRPVLEFLRAAGLTEIADGYETRRSERAQSLLEGKTLEDLETHHTIMSRASCQRLEAELTRLNLELRTSIPAAIERARQLGDLRENAEYEAAKLKQATTASRVQELLTLLTRTRILETLEIDGSRVGAGTEVELASTGAPDAPPLRFWILGEGDGGHGPEVVSYRAPIVRPLLGKPAGSEVIIETQTGPRGYRIASIRKRLPGGSTGAA